MITYEDVLLGDVQVYPETGTVAFSAGLHGWAFTLTNFAKMYASKFGVDESANVGWYNSVTNSSSRSSTLA